jgi:hypothetical protein
VQQCIVIYTPVPLRFSLCPRILHARQHLCCGWTRSLSFRSSWSTIWLMPFLFLQTTSSFQTYRTSLDVFLSPSLRFGEKTRISLTATTVLWKTTTRRRLLKLGHLSDVKFHPQIQEVRVAAKRRKSLPRSGNRASNASKCTAVVPCIVRHVRVVHDEDNVARMRQSRSHDRPRACL